MRMIVQTTPICRIEEKKKYDLILVPVSNGFIVRFSRLKNKGLGSGDYITGNQLQEIMSEHFECFL